MRAWQPLPYSCLGNPVDSEVWQFMVHRVAKSQTRQATSRGQKEKKTHYLGRQNFAES